jgi:hypothetical protein
VTRALCERSDRILVKRKVINYDNGSCVRNKSYVHRALRRPILRHEHYTNKVIVYS